MRFHEIDPQMAPFQPISSRIYTNMHESGLFLQELAAFLHDLPLKHWNGVRSAAFFMRNNQNGVRLSEKLCEISWGRFKISWEMMRFSSKPPIWLLLKATQNLYLSRLPLTIMKIKHLECHTTNCTGHMQKNKTAFYKITQLTALKWKEFNL